jgi:hypothetical protein
MNFKQFYNLNEWITTPVDEKEKYLKFLEILQDLLNKNKEKEFMIKIEALRDKLIGVLTNIKFFINDPTSFPYGEKAYNEELCFIINIYKQLHALNYHSGTNNFKTINIPTHEEILQKLEMNISLDCEGFSVRQVVEPLPDSET